MKCKCGDENYKINSIDIFDEHISMVYECVNCTRRIHKSFDLTTESTFYKGELESMEICTEPN